MNEITRDIHFTCASRGQKFVADTDAVPQQLACPTFQLSTRAGASPSQAKSHPQQTVMKAVTFVLLAVLGSAACNGAIAAQTASEKNMNQAVPHVEIERGPVGFVLKPLDASAEIDAEGKIDLYLKKARITDQGVDFQLEQLDGMKNLRSLNFEIPFGTDAALQKIPGLNLPQLESLGLSSTSVTDSGLGYIKGLTSLKSLRLAGTEITDNALASVKGLTNLQELDLSGTKATGSALQNLAGMKQLKVLALHRVKDIDGGMVHLKGLSNLEKLDLGSTDVTGTGLEQLRGMKHLKRLNLGHTKISDAGLAHLNDLTGLEEVFLDSTSITDAGLEHLQSMKHLKEVDLSFSKVTNMGKDKLKQALPGTKVEGY